MCLERVSRLTCDDGPSDFASKIERDSEGIFEWIYTRFLKSEAVPNARKRGFCVLRAHRGGRDASTSLNNKTLRTMSRLISLLELLVFLRGTCCFHRVDWLVGNRLIEYAGSLHYWEPLREPQESG